MATKLTPELLKKIVLEEKAKIEKGLDKAAKKKLHQGGEQHDWSKPTKKLGGAMEPDEGHGAGKALPFEKKLTHKLKKIKEQEERLRQQLAILKEQKSAIRTELLEYLEK